MKTRIKGSQVNVTKEVGEGFSDVKEYCGLSVQSLVKLLAEYVGITEKTVPNNFWEDFLSETGQRKWNEWKANNKK